LFVALIILVTAFQVLWFASLPPVNVQSLGAASFTDWSNYGQFAASFLCTALALYLYVASHRRNIFLLTGLSSGLWFLSNVFWFLYMKILGRDLLYPCIADVGFLGTFLMLATAIWLTSDGKKVSKSLSVAIYGIPIVISGALAISNVTAQTLVNIVYCFSSSLLLLAVIRHYARKYRLFFAGVTCYCVTMLAYVIRETYFPDAPVLTVVGQLAMITFCLIPLGLIKLYAEDPAC
jgi:hypothetical protein